MFNLTHAIIGICLFGSIVNAQVPELINYQGRVAVSGTNFTGTGQFKFALVDGGSLNIPVTWTASATATSGGGAIKQVNIIDGGSGYFTPPTVTINDPSGSGAQAVAAVSGGVVTGITVTTAGSNYSDAPSVVIDAPPAATPVITFNTFWSNDGTSNGGSEPTSSITLAVNKGIYSALLGDATQPNMNNLPAAVFTNSDVRLRIWFDDGVHGSQQLSPDQRIAAVGYAMMAANVADGAITSTMFASGAVTSDAIADSAITVSKIAPGSITGEILTAGTTASSQSLGTADHPWLTIAMAKTIAPTGTTGAQTINSSCGSVNFAAGAPSLVVTDSLVNTSSVITATIATNDATADGLRIVKADGSFTIYLKSAPTAETRIDFHIWN